MTHFARREHWCALPSEALPQTDEACLALRSDLRPPSELANIVQPFDRQNGRRWRGQQMQA